MKKIAFLLSLFFLLTAALAAQDQREPVTQVYKVKWRNTGTIYDLLRSVISPRETRIEHNPSLGVVVLRGPEEDHVLVRQLLEEYDTPVRNVEFQLYIVKALPGGSGLKDGVPEKVRMVIEEVGALTRYRSFELIDSPVLRTSEGESARLEGSAPFDYQAIFKGTAVVDSTDPGQIRVDEFRINFQVWKVPGGQLRTSSEGQTGEQTPSAPGRFASSGVWTSFSVDDGGVIVLGASRTAHAPDQPEGEDAAIVTVIAARIL